MSASLSALPVDCVHVDDIDTAGGVVPRNTAVLNWLRVLFRSCRAKARLDLFHACSMLAADRSESAQAYADALLRALCAGSPKPIRIHSPGEQAISFDERWLISLLDAVRRDDIHSRDFLLRSRLSHADRRQIGWLATRLTECCPIEMLG
ncbi:MAG: hypothetical protein DI498_08080 [Paracoccus denitrificans]|nr:MAG: hypothetical protein DI498_08080 [Paracoccus denitrificans]PZO84472.1 MAG: hypothetical protein DI633_08080 [Paracoccus denitrificans]